MYLLNLLISFKGRIGRLEFVWGVMLSNIIAAVLIFLPDFFKYLNLAHSIESIFTAISFVMAFSILLVSNLALAKKRLRDLQWTSWWLPLFIIPVVDLLMKVIGVTIPGKEDFDISLNKEK